MRSSRAAFLLLSTLLGAHTARAQRSASRLDSLDFSGVFFANFQYHAETGATKAANRFDVERIYLTFKMPVGERLGVRVTTDIFQTQSGDGTVKGWLVRAKYAYLQFDYGNKTDINGLARFGIVPTVIIDHEELFWPRYIAPTLFDRTGLVSPADGGIASVIQLPDSHGEFYTAVTNGPGFTARESDRFKDYSARLSLTPLSRRADWLKTATLTAWAYRGSVGSKFSSGGGGQVGTVGSSMPKNRWGILAGARDPRFSIAAHFGGMSDASESGANTLASPRIVRDSVGRISSLHTTFNPARIMSAASKSPFGVALRYDHITANRANGTGYRLLIGGLTADLSARARVSLDYQSQKPKSGVTLPRARTYFVHLVANF